MNQGQLLDLAISEYESTVNSEKQPLPGSDNEQIVQNLSRYHEWTEQGASALVSLVDQYGAFMLRNALALAIALKKEDGDLEF